MRRFLKKVGVLNDLKAGSEIPGGWLSFGRCIGRCLGSFYVAFRLPLFWQWERMDMYCLRWKKGWASPMVFIQWDRGLFITAVIKEYEEQLIGPSYRETTWNTDVPPRDQWEWLTEKEWLERRTEWGFTL